MKKNTPKKVRSAVPIYIVAGFWLLYGLCFPLYTGKQIVLAAILSAALYCICLPFFPQKDGGGASSQAEARKACEYRQPRT